MNLIDTITKPAWTFYKWVAKQLGYDNPYDGVKHGPWAVIVILWLAVGSGLVELFGWDAFDYDNDAVQLKLTLFGIVWFLFGGYLAVSIFHYKMKEFNRRYRK